MTDQRRDPHSDIEARSPSGGRTSTGDIIDETDDLPTPSQGGSSGGRIEREIGAIDDEKVSTGADPQPTSVHKGQKPHGGDEPNLPNRTQTREPQGKAPPKRTP